MMNISRNDISQHDFVKREIAIWGEDYIYDLIERGYEPRLTDHGWRWFLVNPTNPTKRRLDADGATCYTGVVGSV